VDAVSKDFLDVADGVFKNVNAFIESLKDPVLDGVLARKIQYPDSFFFLANTVNTSYALLKPHGIPGKVIIYLNTGKLKVYTF
jgi:hypothetical protein